MENEMISCELHDFVEVACMYGYQLKLILKNGEEVEGKAVDIVSANNREFFVIDNDGKQQIDLTTLRKMLVLTPNAKFSEVNF